MSSQRIVSAPILGVDLPWNILPAAQPQVVPAAQAHALGALFVAGGLFVLAWWFDSATNSESQ